MLRSISDCCTTCSERVLFTPNFLAMALQRAMSSMSLLRSAIEVLTRKLPIFVFKQRLMEANRQQGFTR